MVAQTGTATAVAPIIVNFKLDRSAVLKHFAFRIGSAVQATLGFHSGLWAARTMDTWILQARIGSNGTTWPYMDYSNVANLYVPGGQYCVGVEVNNNSAVQFILTFEFC